MRSIKTGGGILVEFNEQSTINFYDKEEELVCMIDPTDLSNIYGAWCQMVKERLEENKIKNS